MASRPVTLGLHLIAKDEADRLPRCLNSVSGFVDEMVVVDTGSRDGTPDIAAGCGAIVVRHVWGDDFSAARNAGLRQAATDWVLVLDADEEIVSGGGDELRAFLQATSADNCTVRLEHRLGDRPEEAVVSEAERLFRTGAGYTYEGRIHEQLVRPGAENEATRTRAAASPLRVVHHGYRPEELVRKGTAQRNLHLLEREAADDPANAFTLYNIGVARCQLGQLAEAAAAFEAALQLAPPEAPYRPTLVRDWAQVELARHRRRHASRLLEAEMPRYPDYPDLHLLYGQTLQAQGRMTEAARAYEAALRCGGDSHYICLAGAGTYRPATALAGIARLRGQRDLADRLYREALAAEPAYEAAWAEWAEMSAEAEDVPEAAAAAPDTAARAMAEAGAYAAALSVMERAARHDDPLLCYCLAASGRLDEGLVWLRERLACGSAAAGPETLALGALISWSRGERRPDWLALGEGCARLEEALLAGGEVPDMAPARQAIGLALRVGLPNLADKLGETAGVSALELAKTLYRCGYVRRASDRLLRLMQEGNLDAEGAFYVGETLFAKGHYRAAASLFEQVLRERPSFVQARLAAAECYMRMALRALEEGIVRGGASAAMMQEKKQLDEALLTLAGIGWHTPWTGAERRRAHG